MKKHILLLLILILSFILISIIIYKNFENKILTKKETVVKIKSGDNLSKLPKILKKSNIEIDEFKFKIYKKINKLNQQFQIGDYILPKNANITKILENLKQPLIYKEEITILPGWNIYDIDKKLSDKGYIKKGELISLSTNYKSKYKYNFLEKTTTLEGFIYPDTYYINPKNFNLDKFIKTTLDNFEKRVFNKLLLEKTNEEILEIINLASIVEKEANIRDNPEEIAIIAGILKKRLNKKWFLGADATVCYPYKLTNKECNPDFINQHIYDKNEYNLRNKLGLPKTAIGNPSFKSINAVVNYEKSPYYYYLHDSEGKIHYAKNNAEHIRNKRLYIKGSDPTLVE